MPGFRERDRVPSPCAAPVKNMALGLDIEQRKNLRCLLLPILIVEDAHGSVRVFIEVAVELHPFIRLSHLLFLLFKELVSEIERQKRNCPGDISLGQSLVREQIIFL